MIDEKILSFLATIFLIIFGLIILRLTTRITRTIEKPFPSVRPIRGIAGPLPSRSTSRILPSCSR